MAKANSRNPIIHSSVQDLHGNVDGTIFGNVGSVVGDIGYAHSNVDRVGGDVDYVDGNVDRVTGNVDRVGGNVDCVGGNVGYVTGNVDRVDGNVGYVTGNVGSVGSVGYVTGNVDRVGGDVLGTIDGKPWKQDFFQGAMVGYEAGYDDAFNEGICAALSFLYEETK